MSISVLLRLLPASRSRGQLAGQLELVESRETMVFADQDEMVEFLRRASAGADEAIDGAGDRSPPASGPSATG
jgi:hypothetical protein